MSDEQAQHAALMGDAIDASMERVMEVAPPEWDGFVVVGDRSPEQTAVWMVVYTAAPGVQVDPGPRLTAVVTDLVDLVAQHAADDGRVANVMAVHRDSGSVDGQFLYGDDIGRVRSSSPDGFAAVFESLRPAAPPEG